MKLLFGRFFLFCTFVCHYGALNLGLQVLALPASVTMARPTKSSQKLDIYRLNSLYRIFRQLYVRQCFFFALLFVFFGAIIHSLSFLDAVVAYFIWEDEASRCCEVTDGKNGPRFFPMYQR